MLSALTKEPGHIEVRDTEKPEVNSGDLLLKTSYAAICSTDIKMFTGKKKSDYLEFPIVLGHEVVGKVVKVGDNHERFASGDSLMLYPGIGCGECDFCLTDAHNLCQNRSALGYNFDGGFAEYVRIPEPFFNNNRGRVLKVPDGLPLKRAVLFEPLSCAYNGIQQSRITEGDTVVVVGLGFMGLLFAQLAQLKGALQVVGIDPITDRREKAKDIGVDTVLDPSSVNVKEILKEETGEEGGDAVVAALAVPEVFEDSLELVKSGGTLNLFGGAPSGSEISIDPNMIHYNEIDLVGTSAYRLKDALTVRNIMMDGVIKPEKLITAEYPLEQIEEGMELAAENKEIKVLINFNDS